MDTRPVYHEHALFPAPIATPMSFELILPELPVRFMNDDHAHARELLIAMVEGAGHDAADLGSVCRAFYEHNRAHFAREEAAMQATGFPPISIHKAEHRQALDWLESLVSQAESGPVSQALRQSITIDLPAWYLRHIQTMDAVTANWISAHGAD